MSEKEKMLLGELYNANNDKELLQERYVAKDICYEYNNIKPSNINEREKHLRSLFAKTGNNVIIEPNFWCDYGYNIYVGDNFYMNHNCIILDCAKVTFGDNVFVGPNCSFYTACHPTDVKLRREGLEYAKPINIGSNVWIGGNVTILAGVTVGDNVTIGAGSVVTKDIGDNVVVAGNPCRIIRKL